MARRPRSAVLASSDRAPEALEVGRRRSLEAHLLPGPGMAQAKPPGVEHRPRWLKCALRAPGVRGVPGHGVPERGEVDADLMGAAGVEVTAQKRMSSLTFDDLIARAREAAARDHCHSLALLWVTADRPFELSRVVLHAALHDREVRPAERAVL